MPGAGAVGAGDAACGAGRGSRPLATAVRGGGGDGPLGGPRRLLQHRLEGAAGVDAAVQLPVAGLRGRLSRRGRERTPPGGERQWLAAVELGLPTPRGRAAVRRLERSVSEPGGVERVLAAAQAVEDVWEE